MVGQKEKLFLDRLKEIFIGMEIEGYSDSGFLNLMRIKSEYFDSVFTEIIEAINEKTEEFPEFREELFDKLYSFMKKYFDDAGNIYFRYTPLVSKIYEKVYDNNRDVSLFWKTNKLYYVKTGKIWKNPSLIYKKDDKRYKIDFDVSLLEDIKEMDIKNVVLDLKEVELDRIVFQVKKSTHGRKTNIDTIRKDLKKENIDLDENDLKSVFNIFKKQNEVDFFITKNAREFLIEQFELWLKFYVLDEKSIFNEKRLKELKVLREIAYKFIDFVSQFEEELVKIWNKPKFAINSNYVITLDKIAEKNIEIIKKIITHSNSKRQIDEWKELDIVDDDFNFKKIIQNTLNGVELKEEFKYLPIDTKHYKELELEIISLFNNLDKELNGWLIKSENYQALTTILKKFKDKVQTIYIDPPFNTGREFDYIDKFQDSTWLTLLENRLVLAKQLLNNKGSIFVHLDDNANYLGRHLLNLIFMPDNFRAEISCFLGYNMKREIDPEKFIEQTEIILHYTKSNDYIYNKIAKVKDKYLIGLKGDNKKNFKNENLEFFKSLLKESKYLELFDDGLFQAYSPNLIVIKGKIKENNVTKTIIKDILIPYWENSKFKQNSIFKKIEIDDNIGDEKYYINMVGNIWMDTYSLRYSAINYNEGIHFSTQKVEKSIARLILSTSNEEDLILDFFLGSGTTSAVAQKLNRKWIGIETNDTFYKITLPRMKQVLAGFQKGISRMVNWLGGGFFKYFELEQYEQTLQKSKYYSSRPFNRSKYSVFEQYIFRKDEKLLKSVEMNYEKNKIDIDLSKIYSNIDLGETLSFLRGKMIKKVNEEFIELEDGEILNYNDLEFKTVMPLIWW